MRRIIRCSIIPAILLSMTVIPPLHAQTTAEDKEVQQIAGNGSASSPLDPEVKNILTRIKENQKKIRTISADVTVENEYEPSDEMKKRKVDPTKNTFRYSFEMDLESVKTHLKTQDGIPMEVMMDGTDLYVKNLKTNEWIKKEYTPETKTIIANLLGDSFDKHSVKDLEKQFDIKRNRKADGWFSKNIAFDFVSKGKQKLFSRKTAWIDPENGLTMESAVYDDSGKEVMHQKARKVEKMNGADVVTDSETESVNPAGKVRSRMMLKGVRLNEPIAAEAVNPGGAK